MTAVDPDATWLLFTYTLTGISGGGMGDRLLRGQITNDTQVEFSRYDTGAVADIRWYAVTFNNATRVVSGDLTMTGTEQTTMATIAPSIDPSRTLATTIGFYGRGGSTSYSVNNAGIAMFTVEPTSADTMRISRTTTASNSVLTDLSWSAIEFR